MNLVENVYDISESFMKKPKYVTINPQEISFICKDIDKQTPAKFPNNSEDSEFKTCLMELVAGSINYCYWYGSSKIRPNKSSSTKMYKLVKESFRYYKEEHDFSDCIEILVKLLSYEGFPLLRERITHLRELKMNGEMFIKTLISLHSNSRSLISFLILMVSRFPGYAEDIFMKRAFLFFAQLNRIYGWFEEEMKELPVPADYQVPKMLQHFNIISYNKELQNMIDNEILIPKGSLMECEIRASTIIACREICKKTGWTMPQIDGYFWLRRKEVTTPFHLTITSDY